MRPSRLLPPRRASLPVLGLGLLAMAGCAAPPPATPCEMAVSLNAQAAAELAPAQEGPLTSVGRRGVRMTDDALAAMVLVEDVQTGRRPNGSVEVAVRLLNCTGAPLQVEAATQFIAGGGAQAEPPTVWKRMFLPPRTNRVYEEISTGPRPAAVAVDLRIGR